MSRSKLTRVAWYSNSCSHLVTYSSCHRKARFLFTLKPYFQRQIMQSVLLDMFLCIKLFRCPYFTPTLCDPSTLSRIPRVVVFSEFPKIGLRFNLVLIWTFFQILYFGRKFDSWHLLQNSPRITDGGCIDETIFPKKHSCEGCSTSNRVYVFFLRQLIVQLSEWFS